MTTLALQTLAQYIGFSLIGFVAVAAWVKA